MRPLKTRELKLHELEHDGIINHPRHPEKIQHRDHSNQRGDVGVQRFTFYV